MARRIGKTTAVRIVIDVLLASCFIAVMVTALVAEAPHEYLGMLLFACMVAHGIVNRRWFLALTRGRYTPVRVLQLIAVVGLFACIAGQLVSAFVLSKHALWFLPALPGASWARRVHMLCSYWSFVFAFAHAGLQLKGLLARMGGLKGVPAWGIWAMRAVWLAVAAFGIVSFAQLGMAGYLSGGVQFAAADYGVPLAFAIVRYASVAALVAGGFHYLRALLDRLS